MRLGSWLGLAVWLIALGIIGPTDPAASATLFVTTSGAGTHSGTSLANAMTLAEANATSGANTFVLASGTYASAIDPSSSGSSDAARIRYIPSATSALDTTVVVPSVTISSRSWVTVRGLKVSGSVTINASDTTSAPSRDSIAFCLVGNGVNLYGAQRCMVARNRIVGEVLHKGNGGNGGYSGTTKEAGFAVACMQDTTRGNAVWLPTGLTSGESRNFQLRSHTQRCVIDSNTIVGAFNDNASNVGNPVVLWVMNARYNELKDNTWRAVPTNAPSGSVFYGIYVRDSSYANRFIRERFFFGDSVQHSVECDLGASGSFTTAGTSWGNTFIDCAFKTSGGITVQSKVARSLTMVNTVVASRHSVPLNFSASPDSVAIYWTTLYAGGSRALLSSNDSLRFGRLSNNLYLSKSAGTSTSTTLTRWSDGSIVTCNHDSSLFYSYTADSCTAAMLQGGSGGVALKIGNASGGSCSRFTATRGEQASEWINPSVTDTTWSTLDLSPSSGTSPMQWSNRWAAGQAGADPTVSTYSGESSTDTTPPDVVGDLTSEGTAMTTWDISWTEVADDLGAGGIVSGYDLRYSTSPITSGNWSSATPVAGEPSPTGAGNAMLYTITGLSPTTTYYAAVRASDAAGNVAGLSNVATDATLGDTTPPDAVGDLTSEGTTTTTWDLSWTEVADDLGAGGIVSGYDLRYSTSPITLGNWASATQVAGEPSPTGAGNAMLYTITGLTPSTTYYSAVRASDAAGNVAVLSNVATDATTGAPSSAVALLTVRPEASLTSIALRVIVSGDADSDCVCRIFYRKAGTGAPYDSGMVMTRRPGSTIHCGRILWLEPGSSVEYYVEASDPDGSLTSTPATSSARSVPGLTSSAACVYVSTAGNDGNSGLTPALAKRTIAAARTTFNARPLGGGGGGIIVIGPGEWHESFAGNQGPDGQPRFLIGDGAYPDSTILDGSYEPAANNGMANGSVAIAWTFTGKDSIWRTYYPAGDSCRLVVLGYGERLHRKTSMTELIGNAGGESSGWWWQNDSLYIQRANGGSPVGMTLHAGYVDNLVWLSMRGWRVANLTLRYSGGFDDNGYGVRVGGGTSIRASGSSLDSLSIYGTGREAIRIAEGSDSCTVMRSRISGLTIGAMPFAAGKSRAEENASGIGNYARATSIRDVSIVQTFNGIGSGGFAATDSTRGCDVEISRVTVRDCSDDAIELDASHAINVLVAECTMLRVNNGISLAPVWVGPVLVLYNSVQNAVQSGIKLGDGGETWGSDGNALIAHNTLTSSAASGFSGAIGVGGRFKRKQFRNNILVGSNNAIRHPYTGATTSSGVDTVGAFTNDFNADVLDTLSGNRLAVWKNVGYSLASLRANAVGFTWEANGQHGRVAFADSARFDLTMLPGAIGIDRALTLPGINNVGTRRRRLAPDVGRYEWPTRATTEE